MRNEFTHQSWAQSGNRFRVVHACAWYACRVWTADSIDIVCVCSVNSSPVSSVWTSLARLVLFAFICLQRHTFAGDEDREERRRSNPDRSLRPNGCTFHNLITVRRRSWLSFFYTSFARASSQRIWSFKSRVSQLLCVCIDSIIVDVWAHLAMFCRSSAPMLDQAATRTISEIGSYRAFKIARARHHIG